MKKFIKLCLSFLALSLGLMGAYSHADATGLKISLATGWNVVSTPALLSSISFSNQGNNINFFKMENGLWTPVVANTDNLKPLEGFLVQNSNDSEVEMVLNYQENISPTESIFQKNLDLGWNFLGVTTNNNPFNHIAGTYSMAIDFTDDGRNNFENHIGNYFGVNQNDPTAIYNIDYGESYGVFVTSNNAIYGGTNSKSRQCTMYELIQCHVIYVDESGDEPVIINRTGYNSCLHHCHNSTYDDEPELGVYVPSPNTNRIMSGFDDVTLAEFIVYRGKTGVLTSLELSGLTNPNNGSALTTNIIKVKIGGTTLNTGQYTITNEGVLVINGINRNISNSETIKIIADGGVCYSDVFNLGVQEYNIQLTRLNGEDWVNNHGQVKFKTRIYPRVGHIDGYFDNNAEPNKYAKSILAGSTGVIYEQKLVSRYENMEVERIILYFNKDIAPRVGDIKLYYNNNLVCEGSKAFYGNNTEFRFNDCDFIVMKDLTGSLKIELNTENLTSNEYTIITGGLLESIRLESFGETTLKPQTTNFHTNCLEFDIVPAKVDVALHTQSATETSFYLITDKGTNDTTYGNIIYSYLKSLTLSGFADDSSLQGVVVEKGGVLVGSGTYNYNQNTVTVSFISGVQLDESGELDEIVVRYIAGSANAPSYSLGLADIKYTTSVNPSTIIDSRLTGVVDFVAVGCTPSRLLSCVNTSDPDACAASCNQLNATVIAPEAKDVVLRQNNITLAKFTVKHTATNGITGLNSFELSGLKLNSTSLSGRIKIYINGDELDSDNYTLNNNGLLIVNGLDIDMEPEGIVVLIKFINPDETDNGDINMKLLAVNGRIVHKEFSRKIVPALVRFTNQAINSDGDKTEYTIAITKSDSNLEVSNLCYVLSDTSNTTGCFTTEVLSTSLPYVILNGATTKYINTISYDVDGNTITINKSEFRDYFKLPDGSFLKVFKSQD